MTESGGTFLEQIKGRHADVRARRWPPVPVDQLMNSFSVRAAFPRSPWAVQERERSRSATEDEGLESWI